MSKQWSQCVMVGPFPPPVHGLSIVNAAVCEQLRETDVELLVINLAAPSLDRGLIARLQRLPQVLSGLARLGVTRRTHGQVLYMSVSGGLGQVYELLFLWLGQLRGMSMILHHNSFAYLDAPKLITQSLIKSAGSFSVHITQSSQMAERLRTLYGAARVIPISNSAFLSGNEFSKARQRQNLQTIGFISNISAEKGVFEFLNLMLAAQAENLLLQGKIAGPFQDFETESKVRARLQELHNVEYVGPKYGTNKNEFFESIDALLFPTQYKNESEPLTIHEAMSCGIPVIAYGRGCIPEIVEASCGQVIPPADDFVLAALAQIHTWIDSPQAFQRVSAAALERFATLYTESLESWEILKGKMVQGDLG